MYKESIELQKQELQRLRSETTEVLKVLHLQNQTLRDVREASTLIKKECTAKESELANLKKSVEAEQKNFAFVRDQAVIAQTKIPELEQRQNAILRDIDTLKKQSIDQETTLLKKEEELKKLSNSIIERNRELSIITTEIEAKQKELQLINETISLRLPFLENKESELTTKAKHLEDWEKRVNNLYTDKLKKYVKS